MLPPDVSQWLDAILDVFLLLVLAAIVLLVVVGLALWIQEIGIQFDRDCPELVALARDRGLLINVTAGSVVRLVPPLIISKVEIDELVSRLDDAVRAFVNQQEAA